MTLGQRLGWRTATAVGGGEVVAVGLFLTPGGMAKTVGSPFRLLVGWLVALLLALLAGNNPRRALRGLLVTAAGRPVYLIFFRQRKEHDTT